MSTDKDNIDNKSMGDPTIINKKVNESLSEYFPTVVTSSTVLSPVVDVETFKLGINSANRIATSINDNDNNALITAGAVHDGWMELDNRITDIDPHNNLYRDNTVVTYPLIAPTFEDTRWQYKNWKVSANNAAFTSPNPDNFIMIPNEVITAKGHYFCVIEVVRLDSGYVIIQDKQRVEIARITSTGKFYLEVLADDPSTDMYYLVASNVFNTEKVIIQSISFHHATIRIRDYLAFSITRLMTGGDGNFASITYVNNEINKLSKDVDRRIAEITASSGFDKLFEHIVNIDNPHVVTCAQIKAAAIDHTHLLSELGGAADNHTHTLLSLGAAADDHTHDPGSIGAALITHTHIPESIGAADRNHEHVDYVTNDKIKEVVDDIIGMTGGGAMFATLPLFAAISARTLVLPKDNVADILRTSRPIIYATQVTHMYNGPYDPNSGYIYSDTDTVAGLVKQYPIENFIISRPSLTINSVNYGDVAAFKSSAATSSKPVNIIYRLLSINNNIKKYTMRRSINAEVPGYPVSWNVYIGTNKVHTVTNHNWVNGVNSYDFTIPGASNTLTGNDIRFEITKVSTSGNTPFGCHATVYLKDDGELYITQNETITSISSSQTILSLFTGPTAIKLDMDKPVVNDVCMYVYAEKDIDNNMHYYTTPYRIEYSSIREGYCPFMDMFTSGTHSLWGTLFILNLDVPANVKYYYSKNKVRTANAVKSTVVKHVFKEPVNIFGYTFEMENSINAATSIQFNYSKVMKNFTGTVVPAVDDVGNTIISGTIDATAKTLTYKAIGYMNTDIIPDAIGIFSFREKYGYVLSGVTEYEIAIATNNTSSTYLDIPKFIPLLTGDHFSISKKVLSDESNSTKNGRVYIGGFKRIRTVNDNLDKYVAWSIPNDSTCDIPINGLMPVDKGIYTMQNPYLTTHLNVEFFCKDISSIASDWKPLADMVELTEDYVSVEVTRTGSYFVRLTRNW